MRLTSERVRGTDREEKGIGGGTVRMVDVDLGISWW